MANVTITPAYIPPRPAAVPATYTLQLSAEEMAALGCVAHLLGHVGIGQLVVNLVKSVADDVSDAFYEGGTYHGVASCVVGNSSLMFNDDSRDDRYFRRLVKTLENKTKL